MEEEIEKKRKKCIYCGNYSGYYTKGLRHFERTKQGICQQHNKIVDNDNVCENWKTNSRRFWFRKRAVTMALYEILMDISAIRQIYVEEQEEKENL